MKKSIFSTTLALTFLFLARLALPAAAQGPTELTDLTIKLWPEYDDPRLLVIIDGKLATPGSEIRLPIPAEAELNAVATDDGTGRLLKNEWREEKTNNGDRILIMVPQNPVFRVEYYTPLTIEGGKRTFKFELPAGYFNADQVLLETLLPPSSENVTLTPPADESGASQNEAHIFRRTLTDVKDQTITQEVAYDNPTGALTVSESAVDSNAPSQQATAPTAKPTKPIATKSKVNPWIILLGVAALLLIIGGAIGLWLTREREDEEVAPPPRQTKPKKRKAKSVSVQSAKGNLDRFCRQCGEEFGPDDRFCRYCGAPRQSY